MDQTKFQGSLRIARSLVRLRLVSRRASAILSKTACLQCFYKPEHGWGILTPYPEAEWVFSREEKTHSAEGQV